MPRQSEGGQVPEGRDDLRVEREEAWRHGELHCRSNPLGVVVGQLHRGEDAHVVGDEVGALDVEDVEEGEQVAEPGLAFDTRIVGHGPAGPAQVGDDDAVAGCGDDRSDGVPLPPVLREPVQQHDRFALADGGDVRAQAGRLDDEMVESGGFWQRRRPGRGGRGHGDPLRAVEILCS